jgi:hypothetical protein
MRNSKNFLLFFLLVIACSPSKNQTNLIELDKMKVVVWQLMKADEFYLRSSAADSTVIKSKKNVQYYQQIFDLYKIDRVTFYKDIEFYESHPIEFKILMDSVNELSKREKNGIKPFLLRTE